MYCRTTPSFHSYPSVKSRHVTSGQILMAMLNFINVHVSVVSTLLASCCDNDVDNDDYKCRGDYDDHDDQDSYDDYDDHHNDDGQYNNDDYEDQDYLVYDDNDYPEDYDHNDNMLMMVDNEDRVYHNEYMITMIVIVMMAKMIMLIRMIKMIKVIMMML